MKKQVFITGMGVLLMLLVSFVLSARQGGRPDLYISIECPEVSFPSASLGSQVSIFIGNRGRATASTFAVELVLSSDTEIPVRPASYSAEFAEDALLQGGRIQVESLSPTGRDMEELEINVPLAIPADISPGTYYIGAVIDSYDTVQEIHEDNNTAVCCIEVKCRQVEKITNCSIWVYDRLAPKVKVSWVYGKPPAHGEEVLVIKDLPSRLWIQRINRWENGHWIPITRESVEITPLTLTEMDVPIREYVTGRLKIVFKAEYSCDRTRVYDFVRRSMEK